MKTIKSFLAVLALFVIFTGCENPIRMETIVHEDGSLDKSILMEEADSLQMYQNVFGINKSKGWIMSVKASTDTAKNKKIAVAFKKSFPSAEAINLELDKDSDTLFRIHSSFNKSFRWFYTYMRYSENFRPIDRFKLIKSDEYFNAEDKSFIDRMPGEGMAISKADSVFLQILNEKIYERYANQALFNEQFAIIKEVVKQNTSEAKWIDTLNKNKDFIYRKLEDQKDDDPSLVIKMIDSLGVTLPIEKATQDFVVASKDLNSRIGFMSFARDGKYSNMIEMPWAVVNSNADSVAGNKLYWKPLATKFAIQEYEMFAEARKLNWWAMGISLLIIGLTIFLFQKK
jgi:hypothetical protein